MSVVFSKESSCATTELTSERVSGSGGAPSPCPCSRLTRGYAKSGPTRTYISYILRRYPFPPDFNNHLAQLSGRPNAPRSAAPSGIPSQVTSRISVCSRLLAWPAARRTAHRFPQGCIWPGANPVPPPTLWRLGGQHKHRKPPRTVTPQAEEVLLYYNAALSSSHRHIPHNFAEPRRGGQSGPVRSRLHELRQGEMQMHSSCHRRSLRAVSLGFLILFNFWGNGGQMNASLGPIMDLK